MKKLENKLKLIFKKKYKKYKVVFAYLFGSQVKGKKGKLSDVDIAVFFEKSLPLRERQEIRFKIEDDIEKELNLSEKVDVVPLNDAQPFLEKEVIYNGKVIYSKDEFERTHYEARAISRWLDWEYYENKFNEAIKRQLGKPIKPYSQYVK